MKVDIITNFFPPEKGAASSRIYKLAVMLQERGVDVQVITAMPNYPTGKIFNGYRWRFRKKEIQGGIVTRRYWLYPTNSSKPVARVLNMFSFSLSLFTVLPYLRFFRKPNLVIVNTPPLLTGYTGVLLGNWSKATVVANVSDVWPLTALEMGAIKKGKMYDFLEKIENFIYRRADAWVAQSGESLQHIIKKIKKPKPEFLFRNLDETSMFLQQGIIYNNQKLKIVYAGLLGAAQGVYEICRQIDFKGFGIELHIYGAGYELEKIQEYVAENKGCNIFLHTTVPKEQVPALLAQYHATIIPLSTRIYGAFPSKIFMAIASGLPIFFSGEGEGADTIKQYGLGWVNASGDFKSLAQNIVGLKTIGEAGYEKIKQNCVRACKTDFDFNMQNEKFYKFLTTIKRMSP